MKTILIIILIIISSFAAGNTYYVALPPSGNDLNKGNFDFPWATFQKAVKAAIAGDTVFFKKGIYFLTSSIIIDPGTPGYYGHNGTVNNPVCFFNNPGDIVTFDCSKMYPVGGYNVALELRNVKYWHFKGMTFRYVRQRENDVAAHAVHMSNCNSIIFTQFVVHNIGSHGFSTLNSDSIMWYNCDAYNCADSLRTKTLPGNTAAGWSSVSSDNNVGNYHYWYGCRAWHCSDDGFDGNNEGPMVYEKCWSWGNGYLAGGGGGGFKFGWIDNDLPLARKLTNCIAAYNKLGGFSENNVNNSRPNMFVYNCTAYKNSYGFMVWKYIYFLENENIYLNNVSYNNTSGNYFGGDYIHNHNSWDIPLTMVDTSFLSVDYSEMLRPRKLDGSLPDIDFMKLRATSILKDKGTTQTGLPYADDAPDLGAWEYGLQPEAGNVYPTVVITLPFDGTTFDAPAAVITISANPSDIDGTIRMIEFFSGDTIISTLTSEPWSFKWYDIPVGTYSLTAVATDDVGARTTSASVKVNIRSDIINLYPNPNDGLFTLVLAEPLQKNLGITIASLEGKIIYRGFMYAEELTKQFNLTYIKPGYYNLILSLNDIIEIKVFIKM